MAATAATGDRLIIDSGWSDLDALSDDRVLVVTDTDHRRLFPRARAAVHHGGAGTTHTAVAAGVPSVVVPYYADQPFWARRLHEVGASTPPLPRPDLSVESLLDRLRILDRPRSGARRIGAAVAKESGVDAAVTEVSRILEVADAGRASPHV